MSRHLDFDRARAERNEEPVTLTVGGEKFVLPAKVTAAVGLELMRMAAGDKEADVTFSDMKKLVVGIFGEKDCERLLAIEPRLSLDELAEIVRWVMAQWGMAEDTPQHNAGNAPLPGDTAGPSAPSSISSETGD